MLSGNRIRADDACFELGDLRCNVFRRDGLTAAAADGLARRFVTLGQLLASVG